MNKNTILDLEKWIYNYVNGAHSKGVVLGMSGGKDSLIVAKLCLDAIGKENVFGVIMPNGKMKDKTDAVKTCELLEIPYTIIDIEKEYKSILKKTKKAVKKELSSVTTINTPPRIRMTMLYAIAGTMNYLVANTSNLSEISIGYSTKWGDNVGDFAPLANFTKEEVCEIGLKLNLPEYLVNKVPDDGLSGLSDEDKIGFTYKELNDYIRKGKKGKNFELIEKKHKFSEHKRLGAIKYESNLKNYFEE